MKLTNENFSLSSLKHHKMIISNLDFNYKLADYLYTGNGLSLAGDVLEFDSDLYVINTNTAKHTDPTEEGKDTIGLVVVGDPIKLYVQNTEYNLKQGSIFRFDGRIPHYVAGVSGFVMFIIWDVETHLPLNKLKLDLYERVEELLNSPVVISNDTIRNKTNVLLLGNNK